MTRFISLCLFLAFNFCISSGHAQKFSLGAKAGVLIAYPNFAESDLPTPAGLFKPGFSVAGLLIFPLKKKYSLQFEGGFSQQGYKTSFGSVLKVSNDATCYFTDMAMGLRRTFRLKVKENVASNWFVNIGPNINYWLSGNGSFKIDGNPVDYTIVFDQSGAAYDKIYINNENRWLFGINLGLGFSATTLRNQKIITELRLTWGQTYLGDSKSAFLNNVYFQGQESMKFNLKVLNISVAYIFDKDLKLSKMGKSTIKKR
jgi:Outer membrane protein beta-barrel domain